MAHIAVVEDNLAMSKLISLKLETQGHSITTFDNGRDGLDSILTQTPDLAILDINLPLLNGFDVAKEVRNNQRIHNLPILMLTGQSDLDSRVKGLQFADDYLSKPFEPEELLARIEALLRRSSFVSIARPRRVSELTGETITHYKILEKIGEGGMSVIYKASDEKLSRLVALKFFTELADNQELKKRFMREAKAAANLNHANICNVYTIDETADGHPFMVMPYLEGETLEQVLTNGPLPLDKILNYSKQIARGLASAHEIELIHRDIKPANIFLTEQGTLKILDFGVAKWKKKDHNPNLTRPGSMVGTINYMPPEQVLSKDIDHCADCWSLGVVMFEMTTGLNPFERHGNVLATISAIVNDTLPPICEIRGEAPTLLEKIIIKATAKDSKERYDNMLELLMDLDKITSSPVDVDPLEEVIEEDIPTLSLS